MNPTAIDKELDALGGVPADVSALIARHAGEDLSLARVDALLETLGAAVELPVPPRLQETVVEWAVPATDQAAAAPQQVLAPEEEDAEEPAMSFDAAEPAPAARARLPWESELPAPTPEAVAVARAASAPPALAPDFAALFGEAGDSIEPKAAPPPSAPSATASSRPPRPRHDTVRDVPAAVLASLPAEAVLQLEAFDKAISRPPTEPKPPLSDLPPAFDELPQVPEPALAEAEAGEAPAPAAAADDAELVVDSDDFEILVDDEMLEIVEDEDV